MKDNYSTEFLIDYLSSVKDKRTKKLAHSIAHNDVVIKRLVEISFMNLGAQSFRAAWVILECSRKRSYWLSEEIIKSICKNLNLKTPDNIAGVYFKALSINNIDLSENANIIDVCVFHISKQSKVSYNRA